MPAPTDIDVQTPGAPEAQAEQPPEQPAEQAKKPAKQTRKPATDKPAEHFKDQSEVDPKKIKRPVLTKQGWVCPVHVED